MLLRRSSSGGAFVAISDYFLDNNNAVVCAVYDYESHATEFHLIESNTPDCRIVFLFLPR